MRGRWVRAASYGTALAVQLALVGGVAVLHELAQTRMMVMRYLFAKNVELETFWFSAGGRSVQLAALAAISVALLRGALSWMRRGGRFAAVQAAAGSGIAAVAVGMLAFVPTSTAIVSYVAVLALWATLTVQLFVVAAALLRQRPV